jgi:MFS family permease
LAADAALRPAATAATARRHPPVWLFALLMIPYGVGGSFSSATLGKILKLHGVSQHVISISVFASLLMAALAFLYAPTVDVRLRRTTWFMIAATTSAALLGTGLYLLPRHVTAFILFTLGAQVAICLANACIGGLMATTIPDEVRGRASGFSNFGNVGVGAIAGGLTLQLIERDTFVLPYLGAVSCFRVVGVVAAALIALPSLIVLFIDEPAPPRRTAGEIFRAMLRDVWSTVKRREGWSGMILCASPVGTAAAMQIFTTFEKSYHASPRMITVVNGYLGGLLTGGACLLGGLICDRMSRRLAYLLAGGLTAVIALVMAASPMTPTTYAWAACTYLFVTGFCYAAFTAFVLEVIGPASASASTQYTLFTAAGNFAIFYVGLVDDAGFGFYARRWGEAGAPRGLLVTDGLVNIVGIVLFLGLLAILRPRRRSKPA